MNFDSKSIAAIGLCIVFYLAYNHYLSTKYPGYQNPQATQTQTSSPGGGDASTQAGATPAAPAASAANIVKLTPEQLTIETDSNVYKFNQDVGGLDSVVLKSYKVDKTPDAAAINLLDSPLVMQGTTNVMSTAHASGDWTGERVDRTIKFSRQTPVFKIAQEYTIPEKGFGAKVKVTFTNISAAAQELVGGLLSKETIKFKSHKTLGIIPGTVSERDQLIHYAGGMKLTDVEKFCKDSEPVLVENQAVDFLGFDKHYFLNVLEPKAKQLSFRIERAGHTDADCSIAIISYDKLGTLQPNESISLDYDAYMGPKDFEVLKNYDPKLQNSVDLGTFAVIARPLLVIIEQLRNWTGNYGIAIILLTILLKTLFYPLMRASSKSMHAMKKLNPQMNALREKYKDDKPRQQQELMKFMSANKINPMKGCLPMLPQIPVFFAFYRVLQTSIQLRHAPFFFWIQDLSHMDPFFVTPILMGIAMLVQQKLTPNTGMDKTQEKIMMFMPVMFTVMMVTLPAGLTLYMLTNTTVGILQQRWLYHKLDKSNG